MKKITGILMIGFLGFLGCSDNDDGKRTVGQATPVAPFGIVETPTPTYEWTPVSGVTKYRLVVQETNQADTTQDTTETYIIDEWYTAGEADCASEETLCMVTPDIEVIGEHKFKVLACANQECSLWSETLTFDFTATNAPRFTLNTPDTTFTDNSTHLQWPTDATSDGHDAVTWNAAIQLCRNERLAGYNDWRLPTVSEFMSIMDRHSPYPIPFVRGLPVFRGYNDESYWTSTQSFSSHESDDCEEEKYFPWTPCLAWTVFFGFDIGPDTVVKTGLCRTWCVRSAN